MNFKFERAHGVTPVLNQDYASRTAAQQAAFVLPYLHPGMNLLDIGCGPGTITTGLARVVAPGSVIGIDLDSKHIEEAKSLAAEQSVTNINFQQGDALSLSFEDDTFDAVFENNVFTHLNRKSPKAAGEIFRIVKPGGFFAARDADVDYVVWGNINNAIKQIDLLFKAWHKSRGSDITLGKRLPSILREAGFINTIKSVSADTKGSPESTRSHAKITASLLDGPFGRDIVNKMWTNKSTVEDLKKSINEWGEHPDSFFSNVHIEVIGWKPE